MERKESERRRIEKEKGSAVSTSGVRKKEVRACRTNLTQSFLSFRILRERLVFSILYLPGLK